MSNNEWYTTEQAANCLNLRLNGGKQESFSYSYHTRTSYDKQNSLITAYFGSNIIKIKGRCMELIFDALDRQQLKMIKEGIKAHNDMEVPAGETCINSIEIE
jgi:uncharacterized protein YvpB